MHFGSPDDDGSLWLAEAITSLGAGYSEPRLRLAINAFERREGVEHVASVHKFVDYVLASVPSDRLAVHLSDSDSELSPSPEANGLDPDIPPFLETPQAHGPASSFNARRANTTPARRARLTRPFFSDAKIAPRRPLSAAAPRRSLSAQQLSATAPAPSSTSHPRRNLLGRITAAEQKVLSASWAGASAELHMAEPNRQCDAIHQELGIPASTVQEVQKLIQLGRSNRHVLAHLSLKGVTLTDPIVNSIRHASCMRSRESLAAALRDTSRELQACQEKQRTSLAELAVAKRDLEDERERNNLEVSKLQLELKELQEALHKSRAQRDLERQELVAHTERNELRAEGLAAQNAALERLNERALAEAERLRLLLQEQNATGKSGRPRAYVLVGSTLLDPETKEADAPLPAAHKRLGSYKNLPNPGPVTSPVKYKILYDSYTERKTG